jgi:hypothetical protein
MMKIGEVKGVKGLRKLMKEIAVTASTGKHDNELMGSATLPLKVGVLLVLSPTIKNAVYKMTRHNFNLIKDLVSKNAATALKILL